MSTVVYLTPVRDKMRLPDELIADLQPWFGEDLDVSGVPVKDHSLVSLVFGLLGQWAVTWNGTIHITKKAPFTLAGDSLNPKGPTVNTKETRGNALWLIAHECLHVHQQRQMGWRWFLLKYTWEWMRHRGEGRNRFERPAYELGDQVYQAFMSRPQA